MDSCQSIRRVALDLSHMRGIFVVLGTKANVKAGLATDGLHKVQSSCSPLQFATVSIFMSLKRPY